MKDVAVGHEDATVGEQEVAAVGDIRIVVAREERQLDAVTLTEIEQPHRLAHSDRPVTRVMDLADVTIDNEVISALPHGTELLGPRDG